MVILNASLNLTLKSLISYASFFDLATLISFIKENSNNLTDLIYMDYTLCFFDSQCHALDKIGNVLYLISISLPLIFYINFDKNFRIALKMSLLNKKILS